MLNRIAAFFFVLIAITPTAKAAALVPSYGSVGTKNGVTNILVYPQLLSIRDAGGWNPIPVTGAGTAAANQTYYQIQTNFNTIQPGLGYAVWTNANNSLCIVLNDTNQVPSVILSNLWTIQDMAGNYKYDIVNPAVAANTRYNNPNPFGTFEVSGLGGVAGVAPAPDVGTVPNLIAVTRSAPTNAVITLSPGFYDIGQYTWFPTNLTVIAHGAFISSLNTIEGLHPYGTFSMFGGGFSNSACYFTAGPSESGSIMLKVDNCQSNILFDGVATFACTDGPNGTMADNTELTFQNGSGGTLWDYATFGMANGATNTRANFINMRLYSKTNGIITANSMIAANVNQVRVVGCLLQAGPGFVTGGGIIQTTANTTNEVSGTIINLSQQANGTVYKIKQTAGTMVVPFGDFNLSDVSGVITWKGAPTLSQTNFISGAVYSNSFGVPIHVGANIVTTAAAVTGVAKMDLRISGAAGTGTTNTIAEQTGAAVIVGSNTNWLSGHVPVNSTYTFTNTSTGAGNSATVSGGQLLVY